MIDTACADARIDDGSGAQLYRERPQPDTFSAISFPLATRAFCKVQGTLRSVCRFPARLETMADVPPGKVVYRFEGTDIFRAKEVLGGIACLRGNVPASLLHTGTPEDVDDYCRTLIREVGTDGG